MSFFTFIFFLFDLYIIYLSLFIEIFSPILNTFYFSQNGYILLKISFILDLFLFFIWLLLSINKELYFQIQIIFKESCIIKYKKYFNDLIVLNILFRFFPIISHIWNFISWYNKKTNKIKAFLTIIFWYIFIFFISEIISKILWKIFNSTYWTNWIDMSYYSWISVFLFWILLFYFYFIIKKIWKINQ